MTQLFLIAEVAGRTVAIDSAQVDSVVDIDAVVPVPLAGRQVSGLAALRSRVVTVIDPRATLGRAETGERPGRAVITILDDHHYAILVDALDDVAPFVLTPLGHGVTLDQGWRAAGSGVVERAGEPILAIDLRALVLGLTAAA